MALLANSLPAPVHLQQEQQVALPLESGRNRTVPYPPYGQRHSYKPRSEEDFGDGGAFPECHMSQFPLGMGRKEKSSTAIVPVTLDSDGKIKHEAILGHRADQKVYANATDLVPVDSSEAKPHPDEEEIARVTQETRAALEKRIQTKIAASRPSRPAVQDQQPEFIRYTPANQQSQHNSGASNRLIRMVEAPVDPFDPPKFKHKKVPRGPPSPPPPVMHSPPRKLSQKDVADWKIPPCISNWKNPKGYTIPLDKRLAADGRGLQQIQINDGFAKLTESLVTVERNAREAVAHRNQIRQASARNKIQQKEDMLRKIAEQSREDRSSTMSELSRPKPSRRSPSVSDDESDGRDSEDDSPGPVRRRSRTPPPRRRPRDDSDDEEGLDYDAKEKRDMIRRERERERERDRRMEAMGRKTKAMRDADRDVSEKVALGQKAPATKKDTQYDARLFSQGGGMDSGFGEDDDYRLYDKPLLRGSNANTLYRPKAGDADVYGDQGEMEKLLDTKKFKPNRDFDGVDRSKDHARSGPVQFEKTSNNQVSSQKGGEAAGEDDPFGLDAFFRDAKAKPLDHIGTRGQLHAGSSGGGSEPSSGSKRSRVEFEAESKEYRDKDRERERRDYRDRDRDRDRGDRDRGDRDRGDRDRGDRDRGDRDRDRDRRDRDRDRDRGDRDRRYEREEKRRRF